MGFGAADDFRVWEWTSVGESQRTSAYVFAVWPAIMKEGIVPERVLVTSMAAGETITTCCMKLFELI